MYQVFLVDDEYYIRQRLKMCIDWENEGFTITGEASSADEALAFLEQNRTDLAVVDLSMPQKDGLSLIKELKEHQISTTVMILSGYGTFEYAQKAIEYGVTQYLLKPIEEEALIKALGQIRQHLDSKATLKQIHLAKHRSDYLMKTVQKENFFKKLFTNQSLFTSDFSAMEPQLEKYGLTPGEVCRLLVFEISSKSWRTREPADLPLLQYAVNNILCELAQSCFPVVDALDIYGHGVLICKLSKQDEPLLLSYLGQGVKKTKEYLNLDICFGCSDSFELSLSNLHTKYQQALTSFVVSNLWLGPYVLYDRSPVYVQHLFAVTEHLEKIKSYFSLGLEQELSDSIESFFALLEQQPYPLLLLEQLLSRFVLICFSKTDVTEAAEEGDDLSCLMGFKELLFAGYDLCYIKQKITALLLSMLTPRDNPAAVGAKESLVEEAVEYIDAHYTRCDISLTLLSQNLLVSPSYLSSIFKKIKGISIRQYITQLRMEKAKELFANQSLTLTEIAERVGYHDLFYFSKVFKRYFGVSPSIYKAQVP